MGPGLLVGKNIGFICFSTNQYNVVLNLSKYFICLFRIKIKINHPASRALQSSCAVPATRPRCRCSPRNPHFPCKCVLRFFCVLCFPANVLRFCVCFFTPRFPCKCVLRFFVFFEFCVSVFFTPSFPCTENVIFCVLCFFICVFLYSPLSLHSECVENLCVFFYSPLFLQICVQIFCVFCFCGVSLLPTFSAQQMF